MSSSNRTTSRGGKGAKGDKTHKNDKSDLGKGSGDKQQTGGGGDNVRSKPDDPSIKEKVRQIMEMTQRSEEEVCLALHECDNDVERAADMLFENQGQGEWETSVKKKKNRQASSSKTESTEMPAEDWCEQVLTEKEKPRNKSGGPPRIHGRHNDSRGWRGREKQENERNLEEGGRLDHRDRRGRSSGPTRGGGGGRGRGGGRAGGRFPPRSGRNSFNNSRPIETWDNSNTWDPNTTINHNESNWDEGPGIDEWSTEEYTGSLADTKVFTPSVPPELPKEPEIVSRSPIPEDRTQLPLQQQNPMLSQSPVPLVGTLNAAQTQYLNQLTQQNSDMKATHLSSQNYGNTSVQGSQVYSNAQYMPSNTYVGGGYNAVNTTYGSVPEVQPVQQPVRTKTQRARVPPPSKIPASAVEMPGDLSSIGYLDVQFGAMDLISDGTTFDGVSDAKFSSASNSGLDASSTPSSNADLNAAAQSVSLEAYSSQQKTNTQSSISSALSQSLSNSESIPQTSEHLTASYAPVPRSSMTGSSAQSATPSGIDMTKQSEVHSYSQSSNYNSYQPKSSSYQTQNYSSPNYSVTQTTSSYVPNQSSNNYVNSNTGSYNAPNVTNAYQNAYSSAASSYQTNANAGGFPATANSYPGNNQAYPQNTSQSVYGANSGLNNSSNYGNATSATPQYNSYNSSANHKLVKDSTYDNSTTTVSSTPTSTTSVSTATSALSLTQTTATGTKAATTLAKNSNSVVSNIPPGVTPVMSTPYIMGQGIPYFQPPIYSYEDMQLLQQRIPHMTTPFYEMSYQTPTTLAAVRDGTLATYSMSDGRFTRGDNNASPVPSTLSQQTSTLTQGHQAQPMLAQTAGPYFFATPYNPMQSYQFGAVYSQLPAATNAHGSTNSSQYPKPGTYGSGYGSGYDALSQSQDYKGAYGNTQGQNKSAGANASSSGSAGNDLSAMYGKSHTAIGKVSSYDKQGFHSGTPPPFSGALHGSQNAGIAPSGTGYGPQVYIPTMAPHQQHHSTPLMHQPLHQMDVRHQGRRMDSGNTSGQRSQASNQAKSGAKQYPNSYWNQA